jgi:hypothetical protein
VASVPGLILNYSFLERFMGLPQTILDKIYELVTFDYEGYYPEYWVDGRGVVKRPMLSRFHDLRLDNEMSYGPRPTITDQKGY